MGTYYLKDALLMVKAAATGDNDDKVTSSTGWIEFSDQVEGLVDINPTRDSVRLAPIGGKGRGKVYASGGGGTITIAIKLGDGAGEENGETFADIFATETARFAFVFQPDRIALTSSGTITPAASATNPQSVGSAVITSLNRHGPGGEEPAFQRITAELDSDYTEHYS